MSPVFLLVLVGTLLGGCATRAVPTKFPNGSAASLATAEAPKPVVLTTLRADPPLPGEPSSDWAGLDAPTDEQSSAGRAAPHRHDQKGN